MLAHLLRPDLFRLLVAFFSPFLGLGRTAETLSPPAAARSTDTPDRESRNRRRRTDQHRSAGIRIPAPGSPLPPTHTRQYGSPPRDPCWSRSACGSRRIRTRGARTCPAKVHPHTRDAQLVPRWRVSRLRCGAHSGRWFRSGTGGGHTVLLASVPGMVDKLDRDGASDHARLVFHQVNRCGRDWQGMMHGD